MNDICLWFTFKKCLGMVVQNNIKKTTNQQKINTITYKLRIIIWLLNEWLFLKVIEFLIIENPYAPIKIRIF